MEAFLKVLAYIGVLIAIGGLWGGYAALGFFCLTIWGLCGD